MSHDRSAISVNGKTIRLTTERWRHIETRHPELRGLMGEVLRTVDDPQFVVKGRYGELIAVRQLSTPGKGHPRLLFIASPVRTGLL